RSGSAPVTATRPRSAPSMSSAARAPEAGPPPADRAERTPAQLLFLERLALRVAEPAAEVRQPLENPFVVARPQRVEQPTVRMQLVVADAPLVDRGRASRV